MDKEAGVLTASYLASPRMDRMMVEAADSLRPATSDFRNLTQLNTAAIVAARLKAA